MTTTGISVGTSLGKSPRVTNIGFNQDDRDKQGITRNTVVGNVEIGEASGSPINRDVTKANEVTKNVQHSTNINVESQTIEYATNPGKLKEDLNKAKDEIKDVTKALDNSIHDPGDDNRNFFGQLRETRLSETVNNIAGERLKVAQTRKEIASAFEEAYSDLGYKNVRVIFTTPEHASQLIDENGKPKAGTAYINKKTGEKTIFINENAEENQTKTGLIGVIAEEGSHIINGVEGRQIETGTEEKGLESTGRATNEYFQEKYKDDTDKLIIHKSDGIDYSGIDFGENVGDRKNEGWNIYKNDLRKHGYNQTDIQNQINWWYGTGKFNIKWNKYSNEEEYREQVNYYYFQAKHSLRDVKYISGDLNNNIKISYRQGKNIKYMELYKVPEKESIYHNIEFDKNGEAYFNFKGKNKKYVNEDGYEVILDENNKVVYNSEIGGTYNFYTYKQGSSLLDSDKRDHKLDIDLWKKYGTGPTDKTTKKLRYRLGDLKLGAYIQANYDNLKKRANKNNGRISLTKLENELAKTIIDIYELFNWEK